MIQFLKAFFKLLNSKYLYAVLRNHESLPEDSASRDIDILIPAAELKELQKYLSAFASAVGCRILYTNEDNQFLTVVFMDSDCKVFQIDFQHNFAWMGIDLLDEMEVLGHRKFNGKVYHLDELYTFLPKYLYSRILGSSYPEKYAGIRMAALEASGKELESVLRRLSLNAGGMEYWDKTGKWTLRLRAFTAAMKMSPLRAAERMACFIMNYILALFFRRGLMVSFSGPDGCGKTTVIELLRKRLAVNTPLLFHFRPSLFPNLGEVGAKAGVIREVDRNFDRPHRAKRKGFFSSAVRLGYYSADYVIGYFLKVMPLRERKQIVFFDRYFTDVIVDGERSSIFLNYKFTAWLRHFMPACRYNFFFRVDPDRILARKQELCRADIERIYSRLEYLAARDRRCYWIDNNGTPEEAVRQILNIMAVGVRRSDAGALSR